MLHLWRIKQKESDGIASMRGKDLDQARLQVVFEIKDIITKAWPVTNSLHLMLVTTY